MGEHEVRIQRFESVGHVFGLPERRHLALTYFITIALTVIMGFQMWTFMNPRLYPMGLMVLALVAAEALRPAEEPEAAPALAERPPPGPEGTTHLVTQ